MHVIILCRSLTQAQRAARLLERAGIFASVTKAPQNASTRGCTYGVKLGERRLEAALTVLEKGGITPGQIYRQEERP
ncbi:MAG: DUF3343 domain-containing protein [Oscillospiraceae bacterium]|nr:DUF3343 domain-containing protein [Oscillospiraceae bacterium]